MYLASKQRLVCSAVTGIVVHGEEMVSKLLLGALTTNQEHIDNSLLEALERLLVRTIEKVVNSLDSIIRLLNVVIIRLEFYDQVPQSSARYNE